MTQPFRVERIPQFDRLYRKLCKEHRNLPTIYADALDILETDPYNTSRAHKIKKLVAVRPEDGGQWRLSVGRFRFRYDITGRRVMLYYCGLRREDTYR